MLWSRFFVNILKVIEFLGDLPDISAKKEPPELTYTINERSAIAIKQAASKTSWKSPVKPSQHVLDSLILSILRV